MPSYIHRLRGCSVCDSKKLKRRPPNTTTTTSPSPFGSGWLCGTLCFPITELWPAYPAVCTAGTRTHQITSLLGLHNGTTDPWCMPQILDWDVYTSRTPALVLCGTVWVIANRSTGVACRSGEATRMLRVCVSQQYRWSDLLLAVMVA